MKKQKIAPPDVMEAGPCSEKAYHIYCRLDGYLALYWDILRFAVEDAKELPPDPNEKGVAAYVLEEMGVIEERLKRLINLIGNRMEEHGGIISRSNPDKAEEVPF